MAWQDVLEEASEAAECGHLKACLTAAVILAVLLLILSLCVAMILFAAEGLFQPPRVIILSDRPCVRNQRQEQRKDDTEILLNVNHGRVGPPGPVIWL